MTDPETLDPDPLDPDPFDPDPFDQVERQLADGTPMAARETLLPLLDRRAAEGDRACRLAAALLRAHRPEPGDDALALAVDRLLAAAERQEAQIRALYLLVEDDT